MTTIDQLFGARTARLIPDAIGAALAAAVRDRLAGAGYTRYALLDRGRYEVREGVDEPALGAALTQLAADATGRTLAIASARALRLGPGDYLLAHHDRVDDDQPVEVMLDLSAARVPGAEVHYRRRGQVYFRAPSAPGAASIVERGPAVACNHTYVSQRHVGAAIVRLVVRLRDVALP